MALWFGTFLHVMVWSSSQFVLLASAHQDRSQWARLVSISSYVVWLACGVWLVLTDWDVVLRRPRLIAVPPFLLYLALVTCSRAGLSAAVAIIPSAVNIGTIMILEWERSHQKVKLEHAQYTF